MLYTTAQRMFKSIGSSVLEKYPQTFYNAQTFVLVWNKKNFHIPWTVFTLKLVAKFECHDQEFESSTATLLVISHQSTDWMGMKGFTFPFPLLMMIAIRNFWTRALANATSSSSSSSLSLSLFWVFCILFWVPGQACGLATQLPNFQLQSSTFLCFDCEQKVHTHTHSLSLTTN
jgi:hypothetical protein